MVFNGRGQGNPLQYSYLENPMERGAWRATVRWVAKSRTRLKRLSTTRGYSGLNGGRCLPQPDTLSLLLMFSVWCQLYFITTWHQWILVYLLSPITASVFPLHWSVFSTYTGPGSRTSSITRCSEMFVEWRNEGVKKWWGLYQIWR